jgi:hypothetical protein
VALRLRQHLDAGVLQDRSESYYPTLTFETAVSKSDFFGLHLNHAKDPTRNKCSKLIP